MSPLAYQRTLFHVVPHEFAADFRPQRFLSGRQHFRSPNAADFYLSFP